MVCNAFAQGAKTDVVGPAPLKPGDVFMYGALRGLLPTLRQAQREGRKWYYSDNAYFLPGKDERAYFRVTRNALQHDGSGKATPEHLQRLHALKLQIQPWRTSGEHVVICPPGRLFGATFGFSADTWLEDTVERLRSFTDRPLILRRKMSWNDAKPLEILGSRGMPKTSVKTLLSEDLAGAWTLVTHSSNSAVEAVLAGIPVFCTHPCGSSEMGLSDLSKIEAPRTDGDRENWAAVLARNQWRLAEMRDGTAWRMLNEAA